MLIYIFAFLGYEEFPYYYVVVKSREFYSTKNVLERKTFWSENDVGFNSLFSPAMR